MNNKEKNLDNSQNQQWLEPMAIFFDKDNTIWRVTACKIGEEPISDGWYDLQGDDLKNIAIVGDFNWNADLLPSQVWHIMFCRLLQWRLQLINSIRITNFK